jgi:hypothetical protein
MGTRDEASTREERLAARLRENLHRRKQQARARSATEPADGDEAAGGLPKREDGR